MARTPDEPREVSASTCRLGSTRAWCPQASVVCRRQPCQRRAAARRPRLGVAAEQFVPLSRARARARGEERGVLRVREEERPLPPCSRPSTSSTSSRTCMHAPRRPASLHEHSYLPDLLPCTVSVACVRARTARHSRHTCQAGLCCVQGGERAPRGRTGQQPLRALQPRRPAASRCVLAARTCRRPRKPCRTPRSRPRPAPPSRTPPAIPQCGFSGCSPANTSCRASPKSRMCPPREASALQRVALPVRHGRVLRWRSRQRSARPGFGDASAWYHAKKKVRGPARVVPVHAGSPTQHVRHQWTWQSAMASSSQQLAHLRAVPTAAAMAAAEERTASGLVRKNTFKATCMRNYA